MKRFFMLSLTMILAVSSAWGQETWNFKDKSAWPNDKVVTGDAVSYDKDGGTTGTNKVTFKFTAATTEPEVAAKGYLAKDGFVFWYSDGSATIPSDNYVEVSVPSNHKVTFTFSKESTNSRSYYYTTNGVNVTTLNATGATKTINYTNSGASAVSMKVWVKNNINSTNPYSYLETIVLEDASSSHHWSVNLLDNAEGHAALKSALTGDAAKDADYTFSLPKVIIKDSKFYVLNESSTQTDFHVTKTMGEADQEWTYYYTEDSNIKYYTELDATTNVNASNGGATYSSNPFTGTIVETGQYDMSFNVLAQGTGREQWIYVNDQLVKTFTETSGLQSLTLNIVSANAQIKIKGKENGTATTNFIDYVLIKKTGDAVNTVITTLPTASAITYGDNLSASTLTGGVAKLGAEGEDIEGTFAWTAPDTTPNVGSQSYGVTFTPTITSLYTTATCDVAVTVDKATPTITTPPTASAITAGQTLASSTLSGGVASVEGTFAWSNPTIIPSVSDSQTTNYEVTFTPTDTDNYNIATTNVTLTVTAATPVNHTVNGASTENGIALDKESAPAGTTVTITITIPDGKQIVDGKPTVTSGETSIEVSAVPETTNQFTFTMPDADVTVSVAFELVNYSITYAGLEGASMDGMNPESYTIETETFTLINPTKEGSVFAGWTGTGLTEASTTVTIAKGSTGTRSYTATWTEETPVVEVSVNSAKTWTFDELTTDTEYKTYTEIGGAYLRSTQSGRSFKVTDCSEETLTFSSGVSATVSKYLYVNNNATYNGEEGTLTAASTAGDGGTAGRGMIAINATVAGTFYAKIAGATTGKVIRLYFADGSNIKNTSVTSDGTIQEISYTSTSAGSFFVGGITTGTSNIYAIRFAPTRTISIGSMTNGSVLADKSSAGEGETISLTVNPASGYELETISVNGTAIEGTTFTMPDADVTVTATFKELPASNYSISLVEGVTGVTFDKTSAASGEKVTITVAVPDGYQLTGGKPTVMNGETSVEVSAVEGQADKFEFTMPAGDVTVTASFETIIYPITYEGIDGADMTGTNPESYTIETETFTLINPTKEGSMFAGWTGTGLDAATTTVTIAKGSTGARSYTATWTQNATQYTLTLSDVSNGNVTMKNGDTDVTTGTQLTSGTTITLTATPAQGYQLSGWVDGNDVALGTLPKSIENNQVTIEKDLTVKAVFEKQPDEAPSITSETTWIFDSFEKGTILSTNNVYYYNGLYINGHNQDGKNQAKVDGSSTDIDTGISGNVKNYLEIASASSATSNTSLTSFKADAVGFNAGCPGVLKVFIKGLADDRGLKFYSSGETDATTTENTTQGENKLFEHTISSAGNVFILSSKGKMNIYAIKFTPETVSAPTISQEGNTVTITAGASSISGASFITYYTVDGTDPTASTETFFTGASKEITISQDCTVKAITISGLSSTVTSLECTYTASSYALTLSSSENGTLTATVDGENVISGSNVTEGKAITLTATPSSEDYVLTSLTWEATDGSGTAYDISATKSFTMPGYPVTVKATFGSVYGEYDFQTWASENLTTTELVAASINDVGNLTTTDKEMTLNGVFSIDGSFNVRKNNDTTTGLQKPKGTTTLTINNLKAGDWFKIDCSTTLDVLVFTNNNVYRLDAANEEVSGKALVSGAVYVVKGDGNLPMTFGNADGQTYIYKVEIRNSEVVPAPVINFDNSTKKATITRYQSNKDNAATVYYTTDGNDPTTVSSTYTDGTEIDVTSTMTIKAMSVANSIQSTIASKTVTGVEQTIAAPTIAVEGTTVTITQGTATDTFTEVKTYYTLDNSDPTKSSTAQEYTEPFILTATAYIKAYSKYNDAIGVSSEVTTYEKDGESKVRVGTFTAEENVYDFAAAAGDFQEISYAADATTVKYYYNADNTASEGNFYEITNTDYLTKSGNSAKILWREKGGEFNQANGGVMAKNGGQKYVAITGLSEGQRVVVEFNTAKLYYNTAKGEGEATVEGAELTRRSALTSGKEITIASGSSIVFQVDGTTVITKISILPAVRCDLGVTLDGILQWATYFAAENLAKPEGVKVYRVTSVTDNVVNTEEVNYIKAGVGVLLYSETAVDSEKLIVGTGYGSDYSSILLGSVETSTMNSGTNYVLYNNQFIPAEDNTLPANRCYLQIPGVSGTRSLTIEHGDDNTTDIHTTLKDHGDMINDIYYTLSGQRVEKPTKKGLYIKNGRKVVIK